MELKSLKRTDILFILCYASFIDKNDQKCVKKVH